MSEIHTYITRGKYDESVHQAKCLIKNYKNEVIFSTGNDLDVIFPRSSIKIFQAIPFIYYNANKYFELSEKQIALSCASHSAEKIHIKELSQWLKKINVSLSHLKCGIHNPINFNASNKLLLSGNKPNQLHNNCAGKHLGMISGCLANKYKIKNYLELDHPYQIKIRKILENFSENTISKKNFGIDGCSAPQYAFTINNLALALINLIKSYNNRFNFNKEIKTLINSILTNPLMIGGNNRFDTELIKICGSDLFCKGGAEGVFLFAHLKKKIVGVIKIKDGNERAIPSTVCSVFKKLKILDNTKDLKLKKWKNARLANHAKKITGEIYTLIK